MPDATTTVKARMPITITVSSYNHASESAD
jgi:hypothetical protein